MKKEYISNHTFLDSATTPQNGNEYSNNGADTITFEILGTSTSRTIVFEGKSVTGNWYPIQSANLGTLELATQTTGTGQLWEADVSGLVAFRTRLVDISGGTCTVIGKVVA